MFGFKKFQRTKENFKCKRCGAKINGNGYTNHCPHCLWSRHVDINPGDRNENCHGIMEPMTVEQNGQDYYIIHQCQRCGIVRRNKISKEDDFDQVIKLNIQH
ncbi:MAG: RNHCP domain-containing protein [bacterium]